MKKFFINKFKKEDEFSDELFIINNFKTGTTRDGKLYYDVILSDRTGEISGKIWQDNIDKCEKIKELYKVVKINARVEEFNGRLQLNISLMKKEKEYDKSDFLSVSPNDSEKQFAKIKKAISSIGDSYIKKLLKEIFIKDKVFADKFKNAFGAERAHHAYVGGLMDHVIEILEYARNIFNIHKKINKDLLTAGILLHDLGKMQELDYEVRVYRTAQGSLIGHLSLGAIFAENKINKIKDFPKDKRNKIIHMILAHHGKLEFGSPVKPMTLEAIVLYRLDELSARLSMGEDLLKNTPNGSDFTEYHKLLETKLYQGQNNGNNEIKKLKTINGDDIVLNENQEKLPF